MLTNIERRTWEEFQNIKMLWWINRILQTFGWVIILETEDDKVVEAYPARTKWRGFSEADEDLGYQRVANYLKENAKELAEEIAPNQDIVQSLNFEK